MLRKIVLSLWLYSFLYPLHYWRQDSGKEIWPTKEASQNHKFVFFLLVKGHCLFECHFLLLEGFPRNLETKPQSHIFKSIIYKIKLIWDQNLLICLLLLLPYHTLFTCIDFGKILDLQNFRFWEPPLQFHLGKS